MGKDYFLRELEYLLMDLPEEERQEALQYYRDYFEEAGVHREKEIAAQLGSPAKVAAELKGSLAGTDDAGEFSERGYRNEWYAEDNRVPDQYTEIIPGKYRAGEEKQKAWEQAEQDSGNGFRTRSEESGRRRNGVILLLMFLCVGLPLAGKILSAGFSVVAAIAAAVFGGFAGVFGLIAGGIGLVLGLLTAGVAMIITGCVNMAVPAVGIMVIGWGFLILAGAFLLLILVKWGCVTVVPGMVRFFAELVKKGCLWIRNLTGRLSGRGGAAE